MDLPACENRDLSRNFISYLPQFKKNTWLIQMIAILCFVNFFLCHRKKFNIYVWVIRWVKFNVWISSEREKEKRGNLNLILVNFILCWNVIAFWCIKMQTYKLENDFWCDWNVCCICIAFLLHEYVCALVKIQRAAKGFQWQRRGF